MDTQQNAKPKAAKKVKNNNTPPPVGGVLSPSAVPAKDHGKPSPKQKSGPKPGPKAPVKVEVLEPKHKMLFGPTPTFEGELEDSGTVSIILAVDAFLHRVRAALLGIVAHCAQHTSNNNTYINAAYAYKFLYDYLVKCWTRQVPTYKLEFAPPVYWDLCDAGTPKSYGNVQFSVGTVDVSVVAQPSSANTRNVPLGLANYDSTSKYVFIDSSLTSYTDVLGSAAATALFQGVAASLKCVKRSEYKPRIASNDTSIFGLFIDTSSINGVYTGGDGTSYQVDGIVRHGGSVRTPWLYHMSICKLSGNGNTSHPYASAPAHEVFSSPAAIAVHRLMTGMAGSEGANQRVVLKPLFIQDYVFVFDALWAYVDKMFDPSGASHIFKTSGSALGVDDVAYVLQLVVNRQFSGWNGVSASWAPSVTNSRALSVGTASVPSRGYGSLMFPKVLTDMIARLKPFRKDQTKTLGYHIHYYPVLCSYATGVPLTGSLYGTSGFLVGIWNFLTNLVNSTTGDVAAAMDSTNWPALMGGWQSGMRIAASFWDMAAPHSHSPVNFTCLSRMILNSNYTNGVQGTASDRKITEDVGYLVDRSILPSYLVQDVATANQVRYLHGQGIYEAQTDQNTAQRDLVVLSLLPSIHPLDGSSSDYLKAPESNNNGSMVGSIASVALGGAISHGANRLYEGMSQSLPQLAANVGVGYGLYSRLRGRPQAYEMV